MSFPNFKRPGRRLVLSLLMAGALLSCDQGVNTAGSGPEWHYSILAQDSASARPLDSVNIEARGDADSVFAVTRSPDGRADLPPVFGRKVVFILSRNGYATTQLADSASPRDTGLVDIERVLKVKMLQLGSLSGSQAVVILRDDDGNRINGGQAVYDDSLGLRRTQTDGDNTGQIGLVGLPMGENTVLIQRAGYLGRRIDLQVDKVDPLAAPPRVSATLLKLQYGISGMVFIQGLGAAYPLASGSVEFRGKDSTAVPQSFRALIKDGKYDLEGLPGVDGDVRIFRTAGGIEPAQTRSISALEVEADGALAPFTLAPQQDSSGAPLVIALPLDSVGPQDTLRFEFNQKVAAVVQLRFGMPNISPELFVSPSWDSSGKVLKVVQRLDTWQAGKRYDYTLRLRNAQGDFFNRPGDTSGSINGGFLALAVKDTAVAALQGLSGRWAFFNSGDNPRFDSLDVNSSSLPDSTSRFARLRWSFDGGKGNRPDSVVLFLRDGSAVAPGFRRFDAYPAGLDSVNVDFGAWYAIRAGTSSLPAWPLRLAPQGRIEAQLVPKMGDLLLDSSRFALPTVQQGMGPSLWVQYDIGTGLNTASGATDTILVSFLTSASPGASAYDFGGTGLRVPTTLNGVLDTAQLDFRWIDAKSGRLIYRFNQYPPLNAHLKADLDGVLLGDRPIWIRNRNADVTLP